MTSEEANQAPPRNRMAVALLALVGLFIALYLLAYSVGLVPLVCGISQCETVQMSEWAKVLPGRAVPVPALGVVGYMAILTVALLGVQPERASSRGIGMTLLALSGFGLAYSAFLTFLEAFVIHAWCVWCIASAVIMTLIFLFSLPELRRGT